MILLFFSIKKYTYLGAKIRIRILHRIISKKLSKLNRVQSEKNLFSESNFCLCKFVQYKLFMNLVNKIKKVNVMVLHSDNEFFSSENILKELFIKKTNVLQNGCLSKSNVIKIILK